MKIENSAPARPQRGLQAADLVVEELVEGGLTRFAAFYQSRDPGVVGPVRSVRNVDAQIAGPTRGVLAFSGGAKVALAVVRKADLRLVQPGDLRGAFSRDPARRAPHNLYLGVSRVWANPDPAHSAPPPPYLPFAEGATAPALPSGPSTRAVTRAVVRFSAAARPAWSYDVSSRRWVRSESGGRPAVETSGARLTADAVLVLRVRVGDAGYRDPAGNPVPETRFTGTGPATLLAAGTAVTGTWSKGAAEAPLQLARADGSPLTVPPGRTWVELLPVAGTLTLS